MEDDEFSVKDRPCLWCWKPLGRYSVQPQYGAWVHRECDVRARKNIETLGRYLDTLNMER